MALVSNAIRFRPAIVRAAEQAPPGGDDSFDHPHALGQDHARYGLTPPLERLCINPRMQQGWRAGRAAIGRRTLPATPQVRRWLAWRLEALAHGVAWESVQLTPQFLRQIEAATCPVTGAPLSWSEGAAEPADPDAPRLVRLRPDAGYAAGHLAAVSVDAARAMTGLDWRAAHQCARRLAAAGPAALPSRERGLGAAAWARLAVLMSFVAPLTHAEAAALPLVALPPNRVRLLNPLQALQVALVRAWLGDAPNRRIAALRQALPALDARLAFDVHVAALHAAATAHARAAGRHGGLDTADLLAAGADRLVVASWRRFARRVEPVDCLAALATDGDPAMQPWPEPAMTEGWALESSGRIRRSGALGLPLLPRRGTADGIPVGGVPPFAGGNGPMGATGRRAA